MSAYLIITRVETHAPEEMELYRSKLAPARAGHKFTSLAAYGRQRVLEGEPSEAHVILEFATFEEAEAFYFDPAYQEAAKHRWACGPHRAVIVQGK
jgi:uncharacterized protein (DUF1330 family)